MIATATSQRWEPAELLRVLLAEEAAGRDQATIAMRRRSSGLPAGKTFDAWDEGASPIPKQTQRALRTLVWIERAEAICVCGSSGTGKSHLVEALGHLAIDRARPSPGTRSNRSPSCCVATAPTTPSPRRSAA